MTHIADHLDEDFNPSQELIDSLRLRAKDLAAVVAPVFTVNSREYELLAKVVYLMNRAASELES